MRPVKNRKWRKRIRVLCAWALIALLCCPSLSITGNIGLQGEIGGHSQVLAAEADAGQENQESGSEDPAGDNGAAPQNEEGGNNGSEDNGSEGGNNGSEGNGEEDGSGDSGNTGNEGGSSDSGDTGSEGGSGDSGNTGNTGSEGGSGDSGNTGDSGSEGGSDDSGNTGNTGEEGGSGNSGNTGSEGGSGNSGNTGSEGGSGDTGDTGEEGGSGNTGNTGEEGGSGNSGNTGSEGSGTDGKEESSGTPGSPAVPGGTQGGTEGNTGLPGDTLIPGEGEGLLEKEDGLTDEEKMPGEEEEEKKDPEEEELEVPDPMTVEFLEKVMGLSDDGTAQARPMRAPAKDGTDSKVVYEIGVKAQDKDTDTSLSGTNIPTKIPMGWIEDAGITADVEVDGKHYTFCGVTVDGESCVFIGQYEDIRYYSTDGISAVQLGDSEVVLNYWEYYNVTISATGTTTDSNEVASGTIIATDFSVDTSGILHSEEKTLKSGDDPLKLRIYTDEKLEWVVEPGTESTTGAKYIIDSITVDEIPREALKYEEQYGLEEKLDISSDRRISVIFAEQKQYKVFFDPTGIYPSEGTLPDEVSFNKGITTVLLGPFYTKKDTFITELKLNGKDLNVPSGKEVSPIPQSTKSLTTSIDVNGDGQNDYEVKITVTGCYEIKDYERQYDISITALNQTIGICEDLNFIPKYEQDQNSSLELRLYVNDKRSGDGVEVIKWTGKEATPAQQDDGTIYSVRADGDFRKRSVHLFFFKVKPGYYIADDSDKHPKVTSITSEDQDFQYFFENTGWTDGTLNEAWKAPDYKWIFRSAGFDYELDNWTALDPGDALEYARENGYVYSVRFAGDNTTRYYDQYKLDIKVYAYDIYVHYTDSSNDPAVEGVPEGYFGPYEINHDGHIMKEAPTREGYIFKGWKPVKTIESDEIYQPGDRFEFTEKNLYYGKDATVDGKDAWVCEFEPVWEQADATYKVNHYLPKEGMDGEYELTETQIIVTPMPEKEQTIVVFPIDGEKDIRFEGYEPDYEYSKEHGQISAVTSQENPFKGELNLYYQKVRKAYVDYTWEENLGDTHSEDWNDREGYIWEDRERGNSLGIGEKFYLPDIAKEKWPEGKKFEGWKLTNDSSGQTYQANKEFEITEENWSSVILHKPETDGSHEDWYQYEFYPVWETVAADLTIEKKVTGPFGSHSKEFDFTLMAAPPEDMEDEILAGKTYNVTGKDGLTEITFAQISATEPLAATFKLKAGDTITIEDLPVGWTYTITETGTENYKASVQLNDGQKKESEEGKDATQEVTLRTDGDTVVYTNHCTITVPETGVHLPVAPWTMMLLMTAGMGAVYVLGRRRRQ